MSLNKEIRTQHDNDSYCFKNHICTTCEYERVLSDEEPCASCKIHDNCEWKPKSEKEEQ